MWNLRAEEELAVDGDHVVLRYAHDGEAAGGQSVASKPRLAVESFGEPFDLGRAMLKIRPCLHPHYRDLLPKDECRTSASAGNLEKTTRPQNRDAGARGVTNSVTKFSPGQSQRVKRGHAGKLHQPPRNADGCGVPSRRDTAGHVRSQS